MSLKRTWLGLVMTAALAIACGGSDDNDGGGGGGNGNDANGGGGNDTNNGGSGNTNNGGSGNTNNGGNGNPGNGEPFEITHPIGKTFWHQGFKIDVDELTYAGSEPNFSGDQIFTVTIEADFTNEGEDSWALGSTVLLSTADDSWTPSSGNSDVPSVPGGTTLSGEFVYVVDEDFDFDTSFLLIGGNNQQQARVPLGSNAGELIALEPKEIAITGTTSLTLIDLEFTSAELRADDYANHEQMDEDTLALTLYFSATSRRTGNWQLFNTAFSLTLPGGSTVPAAGALLGGGLDGSAAGVTTDDLYVRFEIDEPEAGSYVLHFAPENSWPQEGDPEEGVTLEFELE